MPINKFDGDKLSGKRESFDNNLFEVQEHWQYLTHWQRAIIDFEVLICVKKSILANRLAYLRVVLLSALGAAVIVVPTVSRQEDERRGIWRNIPKDQRDRHVINAVLFLHKKQRREVRRVVIVSALGDLCGVLPHMLPIILLLPVIMRW